MQNAAIWRHNILQTEMDVGLHRRSYCPQGKHHTDCIRFKYRVSDWKTWKQLVTLPMYCMWEVFSTLYSAANEIVFKEYFKEGELHNCALNHRINSDFKADH